MTRGMQGSDRTRGFTLIEILVAMAVLGVIVVAVARLFEESTVAWDSGWRRAEIMMTGRAVADFAGLEASMAVDDSAIGGAEPRMDSILYRIGAGALRQVEYENNGGAKRDMQAWNDGNGSWGSWRDQDLVENSPGQIEIAEFDVAFVPAGGPRYADIWVRVRSSDKGRVEERDFLLRRYLVNRDQFRYEQ